MTYNDNCKSDKKQVTVSTVGCIEVQFLDCALGMTQPIKFIF